jgi:hypothetical protein
MSEIQQSDALKKLVWFIIALAILGTVIAMIHYFAIDLPLQQALLHAPMNSGEGSCDSSTPWMGCKTKFKA